MTASLKVSLCLCTSNAEGGFGRAIGNSIKPLSAVAGVGDVRDFAAVYFLLRLGRRVEQRLDRRVSVLLRTICARQRSKQLR